MASSTQFFLPTSTWPQLEKGKQVTREFHVSITLGNITCEKLLRGGNENFKEIIIRHQNLLDHFVTACCHLETQPESEAKVYLVQRIQQQMHQCCIARLLKYLTGHPLKEQANIHQMLFPIYTYLGEAIQNAPEQRVLLNKCRRSIIEFGLRYRAGRWLQVKDKLAKGYAPTFTKHLPFYSFLLADKNNLVLIAKSSIGIQICATEDPQPILSVFSDNWQTIANTCINGHFPAENRLCCQLIYVMMLRLRLEFEGAAKTLRRMDSAVRQLLSERGQDDNHARAVFWTFTMLDM